MTETERITNAVYGRHLTPADGNVLELRLLALGQLAAYYELRAEQSSGPERLGYRSKAEEFRQRQWDLLNQPGPQLVPESLIRALDNCCPVCGENPGIFAGGQPFCINCRSQGPAYLYADVLNEGPNVSKRRRLTINYTTCFLVAMALAAAAAMIWRACYHA